MSPLGFPQRFAAQLTGVQKTPKHEVAVREGQAGPKAVISAASSNPPLHKGGYTSINVYQWTDTAKEGGLLGYGPRQLTGAFLRIPGRLDKLLRSRA
jgi:hypothetical protein